MASKESYPVIELVRPNTSKKSKLKGGSMHRVDDEYLIKNLHNKNL